MLEYYFPIRMVYFQGLWWAFQRRTVSFREGNLPATLGLQMASAYHVNRATKLAVVGVDCDSDLIGIRVVESN